MLSRRQFIASSVALTATQLQGAPPRTSVIDTHLHCFAGKEDKRFPYHKDAPYTPEPASTPEHLLECMAGAGVDYAVVVHPEPYQDDHRYLEYCLTVGKGKLKGTCLFFAGRDDNATRIRELVKIVPVVAIRVHAYAEDRLPPFGTPELRALWKLAGDNGIAVQLHCEPRYAPEFEPYIKEFKTVRVLVDHLGRPFQGIAKEYAVVLGWSKYDHVTMKLSAVPNRNSYPHRDPSKQIRQLTEAFRADRLMYGGGFGAGTTPASYRAERVRVLSFLTHLSEVDREKVLGGTAMKLFRFS